MTTDSVVRPSLETVKSQFQQWRSKQPPKTKKRIPEHLWKQAVALADQYKPSQVAYHLKLNHDSLRKNIEKYAPDNSLVTQATTDDFVALNFTPSTEQPLPISKQRVEFKRPDGALMKLSIAACDLNEIIQSFLAAPLCCK